MLGLPRWANVGWRRAIIKGDRTVDARVRVAGPLREKLNKAFPDHWSFMLGEIALYCFIILVLTGTFLTFYYRPSDTDVFYYGNYVPMHDVSMSDAYKSVVTLSFDVRGGLLIRQIHHWAALLFVAAIVIHMSRIFFTGAFRKPRDMNWTIGVSLLGLSIVEGFCGYSLPDDLLSGTGLRIAASIIESIPIIGTWLQFLVFGGQYPGHYIFERLYISHVLLFPGLFVVLIGAHLTLVVRQKHTEFPAAGRSERTVSGSRLYPQYGMRSLGFLAILGGTLVGLAGFAQINPIYYYGPYEPYSVSSLSQPDWYMFFLEGSLRLFPHWRIQALHHDVEPVFWAAVVLPVLMFLGALFYPFLERRVTGDHRRHNLLQRPRDAPVRTGIGAAALSFFVLLSVWGSDDAISMTFDFPLDTVVWTGRVCVIVVPLLAFFVTRAVCHRLQEQDRRRARTGDGVGLVVSLPDGSFGEVVEPAMVAHSGDPGLPPEQ